MGKGDYTYGKNWSSDGNGNYSNGYGEKISNPSSYFNAVGNNTHGYNQSYSNGHGKSIDNPSSYYNAVGQNRHGYN